MAKQGKHLFEKLENSEAVGDIIDESFSCELQPAGELQGILCYCESCWLIVEDIENFF